MNETYDKILVGSCNCGHGKTIFRIINSSASVFKHKDRYTYDKESTGEHIFRCGVCHNEIEKSFVEKMKITDKDIIHEINNIRGLATNGILFAVKNMKDFDSIIEGSSGEKTTREYIEDLINTIDKRLERLLN